MNEMFRQSLFAGVTISLIAYEIGLFLKRKLGLAILNPLLVSIVIVILALKVFGISYEVYKRKCEIHILFVDASNSVSCCTSI